MANKKSGIQKAVEMHGGTASGLAAAIGGGVSRQNVEHWLSLGYVPVVKCALVSIATSIPVEELNDRHDWTETRRALEVKAG